MNDRNQHRGRVLICDDERDFRELLAFEFEAHGYETLSAADGLEASSLAAQETFATVVTDIRMPGLDGIALLDQLKSADVRSPTVILISAYSDARREEAYDRGADGFFAKPFSLAALVDAVHTLNLPPAERWGPTPRDAPPRRETPSDARKRAPSSTWPLRGMELELPNLESGRAWKVFALGRGGACLAVPGPAPSLGQRASFAVKIREGPLKRVAGRGIVQWIRHDERPDTTLCGIEFEYLTDDARGPVVQWLLDQQPRPHIPSL